MVTQPSTSAVNGVAFPVQPAVQLRDAANNPVAQAGVVGDGGHLHGRRHAGWDRSRPRPTPAAWRRSPTSSITGTVGARTLPLHERIADPGRVRHGHRRPPGAATQIAVNAGNGQSATVNTAVADAAVGRGARRQRQPGVRRVGDLRGGERRREHRAGDTGHHQRLGHRGADLVDPRQPVAGANSVTATSGTLTGSPVTFTATGNAGAATQLQMVTQPSPTAQSGVALAVQPAVRLADAFGNLVATTGVTVVTAGFGSGTGTLGGTLTANDRGRRRHLRESLHRGRLGSLHPAVHLRRADGGHEQHDHARRPARAARLAIVTATLGHGAERHRLRPAADGAGAGRRGESGRRRARSVTAAIPPGAAPSAAR